MNTQLQNICTGAVKAIAVASLLALISPSTFAVDDYQYKTLFKPGDSVLKAESRGRITIYDGLDSETVDRAMDEQFDRIDNMMFIRIRHVQSDGEEYIAYDGCD